METFLQSLGSQATTFVNVQMMKVINTGDRALDSSIQLILSTVIGAIITGLITLQTKNLWKEAMNMGKVYFSTGQQNPLDFNPELASGKPRKNKFTQKGFINGVEFASWFQKQHKDKQFVLGDESESIQVPSLTEDEHLHKAHGWGHVAEWHLKDLIPVWRTLQGDYVYAKAIHEKDKLTETHVWFYSDSSSAIQEALAHSKNWRKMQNEACEMQKEKSSQSQQKIYEATPKIFDRILGMVSPKKNFDNLFFTDKAKVCQALEKFKNKTLVPSHIPIDAKLGFVLQGPPGTGKTGFISAVANALKRDICIVDMHKITTRAALDEVLLSQHKLQNNIIVFEEIDCMSCVQKRDSKNKDESDAKPNEPAQMYQMMMMMQKESNDIVAKRIEESKDAIDLGYLLRRLDGIESQEGRVMIATTNHPENIDPALMRPGRFGIQINLTNCTRIMIREIVGMIYQKTITEEQVADIPELYQSPSLVLQEGMLHQTAEELLDFLRMKATVPPPSDVKAAVDE